MQFVLFSVVAQGVYAAIIDTISNGTKNTYNTLASLYLHQNPNVNDFLKKIDIESKLSIIKSTVEYIDSLSKEEVSELEKTQILTIMNREININKDPIEITLFFIKESVQDIHNDLIGLNNKILNHKNKWFNTWRHLSISKEERNIKIHLKQLKSRFELLGQVSAILETNTR
jgi:hypothetical protein